jgi:hypothetical protein
MELNFYNKVCRTFGQPVSSKLLESKESLKILEVNEGQSIFHIDCKLTRKKVCQCKNFDTKVGNNKDFSSFMNSLLKGETKLDLNSKTLSFKKMDDLANMKKKIELERIKYMDYSKVKEYMKNFEVINLTNEDFREIQKSINEDKKICENCNTHIYENNFHKGWKNEQGEYVLLCTICSKKYFNGAIPVKLDPRKEDRRVYEVEDISKLF